MLPASRSGKIRTFARPATGLPGALDAATSGTSAASSCSSPSATSWGARAATMRAASATLRERAWSALPLVENESSATRGGTVRNDAALSAVRTAVSASSRADGSGFTPQSAKTSTPPSPSSARGVTISMNDDMRETPSRIPMPAQGGAQGLRGGGAGARHHAVEAAGGDLERGPEQGVGHVLPRLRLR